MATSSNRYETECCTMRRILNGFFCLVMFGVVGCGGGVSNKSVQITGPTGTVSGTVTLNGKPVSGGAIISFRHAKTALVANSKVAEDGTYTLQLADSLKVPVGLYSAAVSPVAGKTMSPEEYDAMMKNTPPDGSLPKTNSGQAAIPSKYLLMDGSPLKFEVSEGQNTIDVKLTE